MRTEHEKDHDHDHGHGHGDDHHPGHGHDHGGGDRPKTVTIYVNTRPHEVAKEEITFEEVVKLAYPTTPPGANIGYTVTYQRGQGNKDGDLVAGQTVEVKDGMIFDVTATDLS
jgi:hypothetical protein